MLGVFRENRWRETLSPQSDILKLAGGSIVKRFFLAAIASFALCGCSNYSTTSSNPASPPNARVVVFSKTAAFRHDSIPNGISAIQQLGATNHFMVDTSEDASIFDDQSLSNYQAVIFLNTSGDILDDNQKN